MNATESPAVDPSQAAGVPWTCPFCPLLCDTGRLRLAGGQWQLINHDCPRAEAALTRFGSDMPLAPPQVNGQPATLADAVAAAARMLASSAQPLFGGLGTDVAGARALYPLACRTGAICDVASGRALWHGLHALQDRGAFTTTLAEVRARADLIVCIGSLPTDRYPDLLQRCGVGEPDAPQVVLLQPDGVPVPASLTARLEHITVDGDLFALTALLAAQVAGRAVGDVQGPMAALAARLRAARYAVLMYETGQLPAHGTLIVEAINRVVATLNQRTRAATLPLGGGDGAATVNAVFTWLSGLPLRSRASPAGLEHEPIRFDATRLLADGAVDSLLWIASFGTEQAPPASPLPRVVLGHPFFAPEASGPNSVFIPVSTPGMGSAGHLFRTDGSVMLPLQPVFDDGLPTVAEVLKRISQALPQGSAA